MSKRTDITGQRFGRWTVIGFDHCRNGYRPFWKCRCDCGVIKIVRGEHLKTGHSQSCGCYHLDVVTTKRGRSKDPLYNQWRNIISRCTNERSHSFIDYGGRGITVIERWLDFEKFKADIELYLGPRPSSNHSLDRIDNDGNYHINNIRWATWKTQAKNRRSVRSISKYSDAELVREMRKRGYECIRSKNSQNK
jgi:hypothetical protein